MNYFLLLVVVGCYFLGGIFGLYSRSDEREVVEVEVQNKGEWSFQRRDFVRMKAPREQPTTSVERKLSDEILPATADFLTFDCDDETVFPAKNTPPLQASAQNITEIPPGKTDLLTFDCDDETVFPAKNTPLQASSQNIIEIPSGKTDFLTFDCDDKIVFPAKNTPPLQASAQNITEIPPGKTDFLTFDCDDETVFPAKNTPPLQASAQNITEIPPGKTDFQTFDCDDEAVSPAKNTPPLQASAQNITEIPPGKTDLLTFDCDDETVSPAKNTPPLQASAQNNPAVQLPKKRIHYLLLKARSLLLINNFEEAHQIAKVVLKSDPNNTTALAIENYIQQRAFESGDKFPSNTREAHERMLKSVNDTWALPQIVTENLHTQLDAEDWSHVFKHLNRIIIPKISFNNTPLTQAVNTIIALSEQYDTEVKDQQKKGINVVVMLSSSDPEPSLTLNLKNMPLDKILNFIAKSTSYQFDIEDEVIVFRKAEGNLSENLITEFFKISRSAVARMTGIQSSGPESGDTDSSSGKSSGSSIAEEERLIKEFLQKAGVNFASVSGSNLAFDGSQLIVTQSLRNIKRVKEILLRYEQVKQVEIETKFIEVQQGKLDELQLGWNSAYQHPGKGTEPAVHPRSFSLGTMNAGTDKSNINNLRSIHDAFTIRNEAGGKGTIAFTTASGGESKIEIPSSTPNSPGGLNIGVSATNLANLTGVITDKIGLNLTIRALEQQSGSDLMSAPKLTVLSGKTAKITVAQEFIYPKTYGEISSEVGTGDANSAGVTITAGTPSDFETRNVGVEMNVTPTVEENNCISLQLAPKVTEFEGFVEYGGRSIAISGSTRADLPPGFYQPIFSKREIQTEVTIYDGATVVMGGLTREEIKEVNDKVPLLGDIPLIGKLFRSKGETNQKKNLLIFVTANILSPGGTPIRMQNKTTKEPVYRSPKEGHWNVFAGIKD